MTSATSAAEHVKARRILRFSAGEHDLFCIAADVEAVGFVEFKIPAIDLDLARRADIYNAHLPAFQKGIRAQLLAGFQRQRACRAYTADDHTVKMTVGQRHPAAGEE